MSGRPVTRLTPIPLPPIHHQTAHALPRVTLPRLSHRTHRPTHTRPVPQPLPAPAVPVPTLLLLLLAVPHVLLVVPVTRQQPTHVPVDERPSRQTPHTSRRCYLQQTLQRCSVLLLTVRRAQSCHQTLKLTLRIPILTRPHTQPRHALPRH